MRSRMFSSRMPSILLVFLVWLLFYPTFVFGQHTSVKDKTKNTVFTGSPKYEVRAVWLTTIKNLDWPLSRDNAAQQRELCNILDALQRANINTVLLQVRVRGTVIYPSSYEPFDVCMTRGTERSPDYDPLSFAIEECHRRGMELHAWMVTLPAGRWTERGCKALRQSYPHLLKRIGDEGYMNPEQTGTADYIARLAEEVVSRYDVDGIHLDYIRYPETWKLPSGSRSVQRDNITRIVRRVYETVKSRKRWVKVSCSPVGKYRDLPRYSSGGWNAFEAVAQDAQGWLREGIMDQLYPMMYFRNNQFFPFALDWNEHCYGRTVVPGLGIYFLHPSEGRWQLTDITRQLWFLRREGMGYAFFRSRFFTEDTKGLYRFVTQQHSLYPALTPPMSWEQQPLPAPPRLLQVSHTSAGNNTQKGVSLRWYRPDNYMEHDDCPTLLYNVYASNTYPVDVSDARNLIAIRVRDTKLFVPSHQLSQERIYYAVTSIDRFGNESVATQCKPSSASREGQFPHVSPRYIRTDGRVLTMPAESGRNTYNRVVIADMVGRTLHNVVLPEGTTALNISALPEGMYKLLAPTEHNNYCTIAVFMVKR